jgi:hypothetical protein
MRKRVTSISPDCRIIVLYRCIPQRLAPLLPDGFEPREFRGYALAGLALVRRRVWSAALWPERLVTVANLLHFVDLHRQRDDRGAGETLVLRCDTSSRLHAILRTPRRFRQRQHHAQFRIRQDAGAISIDCSSDDRSMHVALSARPQRYPPASSLFRSPEQLRQFLHEELQYLDLLPSSDRPKGAAGVGVRRHLIPLQVEHLHASFFDDIERFPAGAAEFDSAYWLRTEEIAWQGAGRVCCDIAPA